jgi:DNA-binding SARP family transcriptional activator
MHELASLAEARAAVESQATELHAALTEHRDGSAGLRVAALGPLRVEREGVPVERWGGDKAGTRQAQALFAFLFDRGERGVAKDEALELLWPDTELERADLAFHRTLGGLRATLDPGRAGGSSAVIRFVNDRYRLNAAAVTWSDVGAFLAALDAAAVTEDPREQARLMDEARRLYRGDYLDDCPFYGDSAFVEDRRTLLRDRYVDLVVALGERYESAGDRLSAAAAFREAMQRAPEGCPPAAAGLARMGF